MKPLIALATGAGALAIAAVAAPVLADTIYANPATGEPYVATAPPGYVSGPASLLELPFQIVAAPFEMLAPANGAIGPTTWPVVPVNPGCRVWRDWNGGYVSTC